MKFKIISTLLLLLIACNLHAIHIYGVHATPPPSVYVGEPFKIELEFFLSQNAELRFAQPTQLPPQIQLGKATPLANKSTTEDGKTVFIQSYAIDAIATAPGEIKIPNSKLNVETTEVYQYGLFSSQSKTVHTPTLQWQPFTVKPLPDEGKPANFTGAIGSFTIDATLEPDTLSIGDIAKLTVTISGSGILDKSKLQLPKLDEANFKQYQAEELPTKNDELAKITASIVPVSTQQTEIANITFNYFDTADGQYKILQAEPILVNYVEKKEEKATIRTIEIDNDSHSREEEEVIEGSYIRLYLAPDKSSKATYKLNPDDKITVLEETPNGKWRRIRLESGRSAWQPLSNSENMIK